MKITEAERGMRVYVHQSTARFPTEAGTIEEVIPPRHVVVRLDNDAERTHRIMCGRVRPVEGYRW